MVITLVGPTGSGKSTISHILKEQYGFNEVISYTTRQPRAGERNGVDYNFTTNQKFDLMKSQGLFAEYDSYSGDRQYGSLKMSYIIGEDRENIVAVLTPAGVRQLKKNGLHPTVVYLKCSEAERVKRYLAREESPTTEVIHELVNRLERDKGMFSGFEHEADFTINTSKSTPEWTAKEIIEKVKAKES